MTKPDRLSPEVREENLLHFRDAEETLRQLGDAAAVLGRADEWSHLVSRLALLRVQLTASEGGVEIAAAAKSFTDEYVTFFETMLPDPY